MQNAGLKPSLIKVYRMAIEGIQILAAPYFLLRRLICSGLFNRLAPGLLVSLSPDTNTINDHAGIPVQAGWVKRFGALGKNWDQRGASMGLAHHPPLGKYLFLLGGIRGFFIISMVLYGAAFFLAASLSGHYLVLLLIPYIFLSPYFKNNAILTGRYDFPAWPFFLATLALWQHDLVWMSFPLAVTGSLIHPTIFLFNCLFAALFGLVAPHKLPVFGLYGFLLLATVSFWLIPFYRARKYTGVASHSWRFGTLKDNTRTLSIALKKAGAYLPFLVATAVLGSPTLFLVAALPAFLLFAAHFKETIINRFSLEMLVVVAGGFVVMEQPGWFLAASYLLALYYYASPAKRPDFPIKTVYLDPENVETLKSLTAKLPSPARILYAPFIRDMADFRRYTKYFFLLKNVDNIKVHHEYLYGCCYAKNPGLTSVNNVYFDIDTAGPQFIENLFELYGIEYVVTFTGPFSTRLKECGFRHLQTAPFSGVGDLKGADLLIYEAPFKTPLLVPETKIDYGLNDFSFPVSKKRYYHLKYLYFPAWRAFFNGRRIAIKYNKYGMYVSAPAKGTIVFKYRHRYCWERTYKAEYVDHETMSQKFQGMSLTP
jgi:hypothetical protein